MSEKKPITSKSVVVQHKDVFVAEVDDEIVMLSVETSKYYGMRKVSADIWRFMDSSMSVANICKHLVEIYEIDEASCERDVISFLHHLLDEKLIDVIA